MDIKQYHQDREKELQTFKTEYSDLKAKYTNSLSQAINDPSKIQEVLDLNKSLSDHMNTFISESQNKFDTKTIQDLNDEILSYQKEYQEISESQQKNKSLNDILNKENSNFYSIQNEFNFFLGLLLVSIFIVILLIFRVPRAPMISIPVPQQSTRWF
jgi:predicted RND superfamily exporter protein